MKLLGGKSNDAWREREFCVIDVETTGLDLINDEVISIGAVKIRDGRFKVKGNFYEEIAPTKSPSANSIAIHGLRSADLKFARSLDVVVPSLIAYLEDTCVIAHAVWVERAFLGAPLKRHGYRFPQSVIDTAALARSVGLAETKTAQEPSLELLAKKLNLPAYSPHHALGDAMTTAAVFLALVAKIEKSIFQRENRLLTLQKLVEISRNQSGNNW